jgi:hypothetical protein
MASFFMGKPDAPSVRRNFGLPMIEITLPPFVISAAAARACAAGPYQSKRRRQASVMESWFIPENELENECATIWPR